MAEQQGMFGPSAEELQRALMAQQQAADFEQARQFGMMNLGQQISTGAYGGGLGITRGLEMAGRGLGLIPEDPRVMQAQKMEQIKQGLMQSGVDPRNIDEFYPQMITQLQQAGMMDKAFELEKQYQTITTQRQAIEARRAKEKETNLDQQMPGRVVFRNLASNIDKFDPVAVQKYGESITPENKNGDLGLLADARISKDPKYQDIGIDENARRTVWGDPSGKEPPFYWDSNGQKQRAGNIVKAPSVSVNVNTPQDYVKDVLALDKALEPAKQVLNDAQKGKAFLNEASTGKNPGGYEGARTILARAIGEGKLSNADIERIGVTPELVAGFRDFLSKKFVGVPTNQQLSQMFALFSILERQATSQITESTTRVREAAVAGGFKGNLDLPFPLPKPQPTVPKATHHWDAATRRVIPIEGGR